KVAKIGISFIDYLNKDKSPEQQFPYPTHVSFEPLIEQLEIGAKEENNVKGLLSKEALKLLEPLDQLYQTPLAADIADYQIALSCILEGLFPSLVTEKKYGFVSVPFHMDTLFITPDMEKLFNEQQSEIKLNIAEDQLFYKTIYNACSIILKQYYDCEVEPIMPTTLTFRSKESLLETHFQINIITDFVKVKNTKPLSKLSKADIQKLLLNPYKPELWLKHLPADHFEFYGMIFCYFSDITEEHLVAELKETMLTNSSSSIRNDIDHITNQVRSLFKDSSISLGMFMNDLNTIKMMKGFINRSPSLIGEKMYTLDSGQIKDSVYNIAINNQDGLIIEDLQKLENRTVIENQFLSNGYRSLILIPSADGEQILEMASTYSNRFSYSSLAKFKKYLPIIEAGIERKKDALETQINQIIQNQFTNIHASVHWKFQQVAAEVLQKKFRQEASPSINPIKFERVYPIYGQADIVGSSTHRNEAIRTDLKLNLQLLEQLLSQLANLSYHHLVDYYCTKVKSLQIQIKERFSPTDETRILDMLNNEMHPFLRNIQNKDSDEMIEAYFAELNPNLGIIYRARKDFEASVALINSRLSSLIQKENEILQNKLPHYFEKYETDGVEYNIYLGQSMLNGQTFSAYHLKDFRLWQLICMCKMTQEIAALQSKMPKALTTAQLIFVYSDPLDIRFRMDEKHFDVDGAYNVRYEIIKKRIDKAYVLGTNERLTQAGKIAIVYLHNKDKQEYMEYLHYLVDKGWISSEIEDLELDKLQGVEGLKALRISCV
ncbi:MAG: hypothetical protein AAF806_31460, partial [Bacteroidota bacterium]